MASAEEEQLKDDHPIGLETEMTQETQEILSQNFPLHNGNRDLQAVPNFKENKLITYLLNYEYLDELITIKLEETAPNYISSKTFKINIICPGFDFENPVHVSPLDQYFSYLTAMIYIAKNPEFQNFKVTLEELQSHNIEQNMNYNDKLEIVDVKQVDQNRWTATVKLSLSVLIKQFFYIWKKRLSCSDKKEFCKKMIKLPNHIQEDVDNDAVYQLAKHLYSKYGTEMSTGKQIAFAVAVLENDVYVFEKVRPHHSKEIKKFFHCEELLIRKIEEYLLKNKNDKKKMPIKLYIFTTNSPCFGRNAKQTKKDRKENESADHVQNIHNNSQCSCMLLLAEKTFEWADNYGFKTIVVFSKYWGIAGPNYFDDVTFDSDLINQCSEESVETPFKINRKVLYETFNRHNIWCTRRGLPKKEQNSLTKDIKSARHQLLQGDLDKAKQMISSSFSKQVHDDICGILDKVWPEMVEICSAREKITSKFNRKIVQFFINDLKSFFGEDCPLFFYFIPHI